jgi:hypothetical protein
MNKFETAILKGVARCLEDILSGTNPSDRANMEWDSMKRARHREAWNNAQCGIVSVDLPRFLGRFPSDSERTQASRAYKALERAGLVERLSSDWSDRTLALRLTEAGLAALKALRGEPAPEAPPTVGEGI